MLGIINKIKEVPLTTIALKANLLCMGLSADDSTIELFEHQNPSGIWKTGNNGCSLEFSETRAFVSVAHQYNSNSPYHFSIKNGVIVKNGEIEKEDVKATIYPEWYSVKLSTGRSFTEVFLLEGERFFHQAYKGCDYMLGGVGCGFCSTSSRHDSEPTPLEVGEAAGIIKDHVSDAQICLGGGTYLPISANVKYFIECVREIRKRDVDIPVWIEMVPPSKNDIDLLIEEGATAFGFNIELWDDKMRQSICPGKSKIPLKHYLEILEHTVKKLPNRVGSCLLVGLDTDESIKTGVDALVGIGVHPCLLPFRPFTNSKLEKSHPCGADKLIELSTYAVDCMKNNGLDLLQNQGCLLCECCTVMHDIWNLNKLEV